MCGCVCVGVCMWVYVCGCVYLCVDVDVYVYVCVCAYMCVLRSSVTVWVYALYCVVVHAGIRMLGRLLSFLKALQ